MALDSFYQYQITKQMNNLDIITVKEAISGPVPSFSTPFTRDGEIDWPGVDRTVDFLIASGAKSLLLTNGDSLLTVLSDRESELLLKRIVCGVKGKALVLAGGKAWCTKQTLEYMRFARETGADIGLPMIPDWAQSAGADEMFSLLDRIRLELTGLIRSASSDDPDSIRTFTDRFYRFRNWYVYDAEVSVLDRNDISPFRRALPLQHLPDRASLTGWTCRRCWRDGNRKTAG